ncbi:MAG: hypothetical protein AMJ62_00315 [Myxococcales bacterium SG8_38]|nr:MAG: hypothetical protein AMJ62_00315 [Myxococcales bacterium SG8_38]
MRMTYQGLCDDAEWQRHIDRMSEWARRGQPYAVVIDAREVGGVPATQRKGIIQWIDRDRQHLKINCAGGALIFSSPIQQGLWTAISWVTPSPIPVKVFRQVPSAESWLLQMLAEKFPSIGVGLP